MIKQKVFFTFALQKRSFCNNEVLRVSALQKRSFCNNFVLQSLVRYVTKTTFLHQRSFAITLSKQLTTNNRIIIHIT